MTTKPLPPLRLVHGFVVAVDGQPQPAAGLYATKSGARKKLREFAAHPCWAGSTLTVIPWDFYK